MTEQYQTVRDGYISAEALVGRVKTRGSHLPPYVQRVAGKPKGLSGKDLWDAVDRMAGKIITGRVN